ncbi:hypothetical protein F511_10988 [Dorcoceras hygrometricum]|uniref:Poly(A) RNA polymerase mitochondrial-like central palm domain-containing protein n=1 Tax=Dorcoceras hygrometricum TaxID=472368 RepID=A0A2Z7CSW9_9LAMI|nr:hypothetical protein F511_10988 [Dorcoceras hygrometricum]
MNSNRNLLDSLTAHVSLYHSQIPNQKPNANSNHRSAVLRWFSSLSVHQRRSFLTTVDPNFIKIILQMRQKILSNGSGRFIILPDLPQNDNSALPTLCYRKSDGLLRRFSEFNRAECAVRDSVELFSSGESLGSEGRTGFLPIDAMTVSEDLVADVGEFFQIMNEVTGGEFLRGGEEGEIAGEWLELGWLKGKGYYSLEEFLVNKMEIALRLAWMSCNGGKKRGSRLKERLSAAGMAANLFWRKKSCVDWWEKLDSSVKKKVFCAYLGKATKSLVVEIIEDKDCIWDDKLWCYDYLGNHSIRCNSSRLARQDFPTFKRTELEVKRNAQPAQGMVKLAKRNFFFSSLANVNSISDTVLRKLRELLMVISLDSTKIELLGEELTNSPREKLNKKHVPGNHKKKGKNRNKKVNAVPRPCQDDSEPIKPIEGKENELSRSSGKDGRQSSKLDFEDGEMDLTRGNILSDDIMEPVKGITNEKIRSASRKNRKERKKLKSSRSNGADNGHCQSRITAVSATSATSHYGSSMSSCTSRGSNFESLSDSSHSTVVANDRLNGNLNACNSASTTIVSQVNSDQSVCSSCEIGSKNHRGSSNPVQSGAKTSSDCSLKYDLNYRATRGDIGKQMKGGESEGKPTLFREQGTLSVLRVGAISSPANISYEWPNLAPIYHSANTHLPAATDRLHLDVGYNWQSHFHRSFIPTLQVRNPPIDNAYSGIMSRPLPMSPDWPHSVRGVNRLVSSVTCNYDSDFIIRRHPTFQQGFTAQNVQCGATTSEDERTLSGEPMDFIDVTNSQEMVEEHDKQWMSEEELDAHAISGMDYNQHFGGGVMYWNPSDHPATSFSRPPSLCSDDSSWAWREADINRVVDDMVAFSSSYSTNGLTSPSAASFCSPFDSLGSGALGFVMPGSEISGKMLHSSSTMTDAAEESVSGSMSNIPGDGEMKTVDSLPYPILRPIIIPNMSRDRSRADFKRAFDHKSPCVPPNTGEQRWVKRPPSPVVLCAPRAPRPPPPSPVGDSGKHRGFPTVRSGSSSPRHWGVKGWFHDGVNFEEASVPMHGSEVVWPSWRNKNLSARQLAQPLAGTLLQDRLIAISQLARDQEHPDVTFPLQPPESQNCSTYEASVSLVHDILHSEINSFCKQVATENLVRKPYISWAVKRVARSLQVLWPRSRTNVFGSNATGLCLPSSDVDLVVCLPPVRNLEPIKEAGILEGRNGIKETCLQHAARYLANQEWVKSDSLKIVENTAIPIIMLVVEVPCDLTSSVVPNVQTPQEADCAASEEGKPLQTDTAGSEISPSPKWFNTRNDIDYGAKYVRLDISFKSPTHTGLQTTGLVKDLADRFPAVTPLTLVLKQFLADRSLDQSYSGGLSSYCLNYGSLLMDFLYFFGIDPLYIDDPLLLTDNVGRNCFRIHQCIKNTKANPVPKTWERSYRVSEEQEFPLEELPQNIRFLILMCSAFADAYTMLENELAYLPDSNAKSSCKLLPKIIPSIGNLVES